MRVGRLLTVDISSIDVPKSVLERNDEPDVKEEEKRIQKFLPSMRSKSIP